MKTVLETLGHLEKIHLSCKVELQKLRIAYILIRLREKRGLTQVALARRMHVKQSFIAKLESGEAKDYSLKTLTRLAIALDSRLTIRFLPHRTNPSGKGLKTLKDLWSKNKSAAISSVTKDVAETVRKVRLPARKRRAIITPKH